MTNILHKFPHIEQLRNVITSLKHKYQNPVQTSDGWVFDESLPLPTIEFEGTVKLHGTNGAVVIYPPLELDSYPERVYCQSRESVLTPENDNHGFCKFILNIDQKTLLESIPQELRYESFDSGQPIIVFGEWCGKGIQSGVAISQLPKMFVVFAAKVGDKWVSKDLVKLIGNEEKNIFNVYKSFVQWGIEIDFNNPEQMEKSVSILERWTKQVEEECPFAKTFGITGLGEGLVWCSHYDNRTKTFCGGNDGDPWMFKTKGEKHKNVKESKLVQLQPDVVNNIAELVASVVTEQRLKQGLEKLNEKGLDISKKNTPTFLNWIQEDIRRENKDILEASGLTEKDQLVGIQKAAREWYLKVAK